MTYGGHFEITNFIFEFVCLQSLKDVFLQELRLSPWEGHIALGWPLHFHFHLANSCSSPSEDNTTIKFNFEKEKTRAWADRKCKVMPRFGGTKYAGTVWMHGNTKVWGRDTAGVEPFRKQEHLKLEPGRPVLSKEEGKREDRDACRFMRLVVRRWGRQSPLAPR